MSRLRSSRASNTGASRTAAAPRQRGVLVQAPKSDIYVALLGISLAAVIIGCILMTLLLMKYEWKISVSSAAPVPSALASSPIQLAAITPTALTDCG
ncbi:hypothetical protein [Planctomyces sp. SH-PL62]|uniref:hypothetical protein n=1 Tax=Planctomyces sp. SH-PL62 TaxID=1636152 RepID=UPI00078E72E7|nr:hypothetical protein [Planctomyces sp. SH-PL62]AMV39938.1 hypothetical protein VT85_21070 [Planctomyces sp. SH-PL62]